MVERTARPDAVAAAPFGVAADKARLRGAMVTRLKAVAPADRARHAEAASRTLVRFLADRLPPGVPVALFAPTPTELSCEPALAPLGERHPLAWPRVDGGSLRFQVAPFASLAAHTSRVREPPPDAPEVVPQAVVVPGRAFDRTGLRLGRGAGFYDRTIALLAPSTLLIGYAYAFQVVDGLPREPYDRWVQFVVTEEGEPLRCRPPAAPDERNSAADGS